MTDERYKEIEQALRANPPRSPFEFESIREELNEIVDSFNNARYYEYSLEAVHFILQIERSLSRASQ